MVLLLGGKWTPTETRLPLRRTVHYPGVQPSLDLRVCGGYLEKYRSAPEGCLYGIQKTRIPCHIRFPPIIIFALIHHLFPRPTLNGALLD